MKRKLLALGSSLLLLTLLLAGCGANESAPRTGGAAMNYAAADSDYATKAAPVEMQEQAYREEYSSGAVTTGDGGAARADTYDKIIYSGAASIETIRFDETVDGVYALVERCGGFVENSYVTGKDYYTEYYGRNAYRSAEFTIRVPREAFKSITGDLEQLGSVTYSSVQAENITAAYTDTQSRLSAYRTEEARLLSMLEKADTVEDMLNIESRLSDVRYSIESLTTTLTNWDSKVNYSTLRLSISEVKELKEETPITRTFGDDLVAGFRSSCQWLVRALKDSAIFLLSAIPVLVIPAAVVVIVLLCLRGRKRKKAKKAAEKDVQVDD